jgi:hypothetical protein
MTSLPNTVTDSGQIIVNSGPPLQTGFTQQITGTPIDAAANKTLAANAQQVAAAKAMGAGQKGSSRRRHKKRRMRGGVNLNASIPSIPEAGSIPGISHAQNHLDAVNNLNQMRHDAVYDGLHNATPRSMGGKRSRKAKKHGRSHKRTHRRKHGKHATRHRRTRHVL